MATYFVSDIHGYAKQFFSLLDSVSPASDDTVIVGGDLIDRGPDSRQLLRWAMENAPDNFKFLLGNHEDMLASWIKTTRSTESRRGTWSDIYCHPWALNQTNQKDLSWYENHLFSDEVDRTLAWISSLQLTETITANNKDFLCVHAGITPTGYDHAASMPKPDRLVEKGARAGHEDLSNLGLGIQDVQSMLWVRDGWYTRHDMDPVHVVCGHTPNIPRHTAHLAQIAELFGIPAHVAPYTACHMQTRHLCDAGSAYRSRDRRCDIAMLRLDDLACFSGKSPSPSFPNDDYMEWFEKSIG